MEWRSGAAREQLRKSLCLPSAPSGYAPAMKRSLLVFLLLPWATLPAAEPGPAPLKFSDPKPKRYELTARASQVDPRAQAHPEIEFLFEKGGKPADTERA